MLGLISNELSGHGVKVNADALVQILDAGIEPVGAADAPADGRN